MGTLFQNISEEKSLFFFEQIAKIPRESGKEEGISNYIKSWAENLGLWCFQDECWNLIIKKPASKGCEAFPSVILQAHMDMVCEKSPDSTHNFDVDPISLEIDGDWLCSASGTTLGADNGIGVAMCMAVLASDELIHPPLEVLLTVQEETTFYGAENVRWDLLEGRCLVNLDHAVEREVLTGSCGGSGVEVALPVEQQVVPTDAKCYRLVIAGLPGGHSGEDIHRGYGSAIQLMTRVLRRCQNKFGIFLCSLDSGASRLAISREACAVIGTSVEFSALNAEICRMKSAFAQEYQEVAPELSLELLLEYTRPESCFTQSSFNRLLAALSLFPDGIQKMNGAFPGMVESSNNLGVLKTKSAKIIMTSEIRGAYASTVEDIQEKISVLSNMLGGTCQFFSQYIPWESRSESSLRKVAVTTYQELFGENLKVRVVHAGIECGSFLKRIPDLDAISIGPDCYYCHSPQERLSISSAKRSWRFLQALLKKLTI